MASPKIDTTAEEDRLFRTFLACAAWKGRSSTLRVAGGWVRDKLLGKSSHDIDIAIDDQTGVEFATSLNEYLQSIGEETRTLAVIQANPEKSKHLETATVIVFGVHIDFVNLRAEEYTEVSRIPGIRFGSPSEDAYRRDFTINAMFYNLNTGQVEDFTGKGLSDLKQGIIRTCLDTRVTFCDDPLRVLRGIRFANRFGFQLEDSIHQVTHTPEVRNAFEHKLSRDRIKNELDGMLNHDAMRPAISLKTIEAVGLYDLVFEVPVPMKAVGATPGPDSVPGLNNASSCAAESADMIVESSEAGVAKESTAGVKAASKKRGGGDDRDDKEARRLQESYGAFGLERIKLAEESVRYQRPAAGSRGEEEEAGGEVSSNASDACKAGGAADDELSKLRLRREDTLLHWQEKSSHTIEWVNALRIIRCRLEERLPLGDGALDNDATLRDIWSPPVCPSSSSSSSSSSGLRPLNRVVSVADQSQTSYTYVLRGEASATEGTEAEEQAKAVFQRNLRVEYLCAAVSGLRGLITLDPANTRKEVELPLLLLRHSLKMDMLVIKAISSIFDEMGGFRKLTKHAKSAATSLQDTREQGGYLLRATREYWKCALWFACANELAVRRFNEERCRCCSGKGRSDRCCNEAPSSSPFAAPVLQVPQTSSTVFALSGGVNNIGLRPIIIETSSTRAAAMLVSSQSDGEDTRRTDASVSVSVACTCSPTAEEECESESDVISRYFLLERKLMRLGLEGVWDMRPILDGKAIMKLFKVKAGPGMGKLMEIQLQWQLRNPPPTAPLTPADESVDAYTQRCVDFIRSVHERKRTMTDEEFVP